MKKFKKILGYGILSLIFLLFLGFVYFSFTYPKVSAPADIKIKATAERLERGKYLFNHVANCVDCHSQRDFTKLTLPIVPGTEGKGGMKLGEELGLPGVIYPSNITPAALTRYTDGELFRAITEGVTKEGRVLFPIMPYMQYSKMDKEDIYSIIAYVRTLAPVENSVPKTSVDFPVNMIIKTLPQPYAGGKKRPSPSDTVEYGKYLTTMADCAGCHTPRGEAEFSGGMTVKLPGGILRSANITPDKETGIGSWDKETFIARFKFFDSDSAKNIVTDMNGFNTIMPWTTFAGMTREDLGAIYAYLRTVAPVKKNVPKFTAHETAQARFAK